MGYEEKKISANLSNLTVVKKSIGNIFTEKPVFCDNGNSLIVSSGQSLHLYSTSNGNHVKKLFQCSDNIVSYQLHPLQNYELIAVTENGELTVYNLKTNEIEYSIKLTLKQKFLNKQKAPKFNLEGYKCDENFDWETQPLDSLLHRKFLHAEVKAFQNSPSEIFVWATWCLNDEFQSHLSAFTFKSGKQIRLIHLQNSGLQKSHLNFILGTRQKFEVFVGMSYNYIHITRYDVKKCPFSQRHYIGQEKTVTCLAFHPTECSFASGDSLGRIIIWKNIFEKHPLKDVLHWHTLPVHNLFFSSFGNYLFSGGEEHVLVKWSLNSHNKDFLPRLSSAIHHISGACDESSLLSISTMDNKILIINFNFKSISTVQHFSKWSNLTVENKMNIFTVDPRSNCLVLNGKTGHIQFLSLNEDGKFIYTFDVTNRNFITNADSVIENTEVTHAKFNKNGKWLITFESRREHLCKESRLKFWLFNEKQNSFSLNTNVEFPHEDFAIHSLEISGDDMVATTGGDKKFRLWTIFEYEEKLRKKEFWAVHAVNKYRDFPCYAVDFSKDASLIAITFGPILTVWETESCQLKCPLSEVYRKDELKFCKFGNCELSHLLVAGSESVISCWDIITLSIVWTVPLKLSLLISDPFSIYMAAFSKENSLIIFNPCSPAPDLIIKKVSDFPVIAAHCVHGENGKLCLYFLTSNQELYCLEDAEKASINIANDSEQTFFTPYSSQTAEISNYAGSNTKKSVPLNKKDKQLVSSLLDSPAHTLPNPSLLCLDVLKGLLFFPKHQSEVVSVVKEVKNSAVNINKNSENNNNNVESDSMENKLLEIVKTIFV